MLTGPSDIGPVSNPLLKVSQAALALFTRFMVSQGSHEVDSSIAHKGRCCFVRCRPKAEVLSLIQEPLAALRIPSARAVCVGLQGTAGISESDLGHALSALLGCATVSATRC